MRDATDAHKRSAGADPGRRLLAAADRRRSALGVGPAHGLRGAIRLINGNILLLLLLQLFSCDNDDDDDGKYRSDLLRRSGATSPELDRGADPGATGPAPSLEDVLHPLNLIQATSPCF